MKKRLILTLSIITIIALAIVYHFQFTAPMLTATPQQRAIIEQGKEVISEAALAYLRPMAPRFEVFNAEGKLIPAADLPLLHTEADVNIAGVIADVKVTQIYVNSGNQALEAVYVFPGTSQSAVYGMKMTIEDRIIEAQIKEKQQAKIIYDKAKKEGKSASLLQQHQPNVFQMNVANLLPGDTIKVELSYNELLIPENGVYTFFYPAVMGERYDGGKNGGKEYMKHAKISNNHSFDINVQLAAGMELEEVDCPSHEVAVSYNDPTRANIQLKNGKTPKADRNYVLHYRLSGEDFASGMMLYEGEEENFFLTMIHPPKRLEMNLIPPREYVFIVDISGSMNGYPIETSKALLNVLMNDLRPYDLFNVLLFAGSSEVLAEESIPATPENIENAIALIESHSRGGGGTEVLPALKKAFALPTADDYSRTFIVATDGLVTVEREAFELIRNNLGEANIFPFGIGDRLNEFMIEGMAHAGQGEAFIITNEKEALAQAERFRKMIQAPVLTNIQTNIQGFEAYDIEPLSLPDVFAERPLVIFGKYRGAAKGNFTLSGQSGKAPYSTTIDIQNYQANANNEALKYLWARQKIRMLQDYNNLGYKDQQLINEITELGLQYNLLTDYTSFVAVDNQVRRDKTLAENKMKKIQHHNSGAVPEPHEWALIALLGAFGMWVYFKKKSLC